ncbi:hypothetical protein LXH13_25530 [Streptomyces spinosirectus]|jgi:hypothetical protein|uniref:hypothetical protein n=1 Tax=Streptomyces TaxID=1883 RepID=UPI001C9D97E6|nr:MULTISPECIES: hypothetical protein [Streptomyces]MBY8344804.1 hypothetical protein [Streptomyces plumbidurans]UIR20186.1 hypothetical protein LXH13_25530 [Streptomyces spinosirectus]
MTATPFITDASAQLPGTDIWFALPAGFSPIPMGELQSSGIDAGTPDGDAVLSSLLATAGGPTEQQQLEAMCAPVRRMMLALAATGVIQCSVGLHTDDEGDGRLLLSLFTLAWRRLPWSPRSIMAARIAASAENAVHLEMLELPCGPGSLVETHVAASDARLGERLLQVSAYVPYPDGERLAILNLATPAVEHADHYRALLREIAYLVSFDNPLSPESDKE